jgi:hypothetical protein
MTPDTPRTAAARIEVDRARGQLRASVMALETPLLRLKDQLTPSHIAKDLIEGAKNKGADLAEDAVDAVRARPIAATGVVAALALFLAREPLMDLAGKATQKVRAKRARKRKTKSTEKVA